MLTDVPWRWDVVRHELKTEAGCWLPASAPGLGIELTKTPPQSIPLRPK
jgi:galactonate dehydratase